MHIMEASFTQLLILITMNIKYLRIIFCISINILFSLFYVFIII